MPINLSVKINNQLFLTDNIIILNDRPVITWDFDKINSVEIDGDDGIIDEIDNVQQTNFEIRIGTSNNNLGTNIFFGNIVQTGIVAEINSSWIFKGGTLSRGNNYFGQIFITDQIGRISEWATFGFEFNSLPQASTVLISPDIPTVNDDLEVSYTYSDDSGIEGEPNIHWFKSGIHQKHLDSAIKVDSRFLQVGDVWSVEVIPFDGFEFGNRSISPSVKISINDEISSDLKILPESPNENDILKASFDVLNFNLDAMQIRWFINDILFSDFNDKQFVRLDVSSGDIVKYQARLLENDAFLTSESKTIQFADFVISDIKIDGQRNPLDIITIRPVISWNSHSSSSRSSKYVNVKVGTFFGGDNIYSEIVSTSFSNFRFPADILEKGKDYFLSIAVNDSNSNFVNFSYAKFRVTGSSWSINVNNSVGWTFETAFIIDETGTFDNTKFQSIMFQDGTKFAEVRIYNNKIGFLSKDMVLSENLDTSGVRVLTVTCINDDIKIYLDKKIIIDGIGLLLESTFSKILEVGSKFVSGFIIFYKYFYYTTKGSFSPDSSTEYNDLQFFNAIKFPLSEIIDFKDIVDNDIKKDAKIFGVNPQDESEGGDIYQIISSEEKKYKTVNKTYSPINKIKLSPNGENIVLAHSRGISIFNSYRIGEYTDSIVFDDGNNLLPDSGGWDLIQNIGTDVVSFNSDGLNINTLFKE